MNKYIVQFAIAPHEYPAAPSFDFYAVVFADSFEAVRGVFEFHYPMFMYGKHWPADMFLNVKTVGSL